MSSANVVKKKDPVSFLLSISNSGAVEPRKQRLASGQQRQNSYNAEYLDNDKQFDLLKELQDEIQDLRYENNELKFLLYVALRHVKIDEKTKKDDFKWEMEKLARDFLDDPGSNKNLQLELETATNMLEEAKWVQNHYEARVRHQEFQIEELQKRLFEMTTKELTLMQLKLPPPEYRSSSRAPHRAGNEPAKPSHLIRTTGRQRSLSTTSQQRIGTNKKGSCLPDNYKQSVATLPPILNEQGNKPNETSFWTHRMKKVT